MNNFRINKLSTDNTSGTNAIHKRKSTIRNNNKSAYCSNCGNRGHEYKQCKEAITSFGIILVTYGSMLKPIHEDKINLSDDSLSEPYNRVLISSDQDRMIIRDTYTNLMFLMISRKHSVGYVDFVRGRYKPEKTDHVMYLFKQMMEKEINRIRESLDMDDGFNYLWREFWGTKCDCSYLAQDRIAANNKYNTLKYTGVDGPEIGLKYILSIIKLDYDTEEWGFPKGRRNKFESDRTCAIREFKEESAYKDEDFVMIDNIEPLVERFTGTNGVEYRHIYYVAELVSDKMPGSELTDIQKIEVGNIRFMNFDNANQYIRDYHIARKQIVEKLFIYYVDRLIISNRININESQQSNINAVDMNTDQNEITVLD